MMIQGNMWDLASHRKQNEFIELMANKERSFLQVSFGIVSRLSANPFIGGKYGEYIVGIQLQQRQWQN